MRNLAILATLMWFGCGSSPTGSNVDDVPADVDLAILFVGNSLTYTNDLPDMVQRLLQAHGNVGDVGVGTVAFPNFGLMDHWAQGAARSAIASGQWDYVVIQQGPSATEGRPSLLEYSRRFADEVEAVGGRLALYMVWPAANRFLDFNGVSASYEAAAEQNDSLLFPAGEAWREAWALDPNLDLYGPDGFHPSLLGTHLAALVIYQQLSGKDPRALPAEIPTAGGTLQLPIELGDVLHDAAAAANAEFARP
ncbi:MAG: SGNH/GDSL hydrolase family protein [Gemmatimonadota bacterium]